MEVSVMSDVLVPANNLLVKIESLLKKTNSPYEWLNGNEGFRIQQRKYFNSWIVFERHDEILNFIGKIIYDLWPNELQSVSRNIDDVNAKIPEGKFFVAHQHLGFALAVRVKNRILTDSILTDWINLPLKMIEENSVFLFAKS
jgi:hypothetical protein